DFFQQLRDRMEPQHAPKRLKQWLGMLRTAYPEAEILYQKLRAERDPVAVAKILAAQDFVNCTDSIFQHGQNDIG
ncbi:MAG: hypothetical protein ABL915_02070, partial [Gallionella sp.]